MCERLRHKKYIKATFYLSPKYPSTRSSISKNFTVSLERQDKKTEKDYFEKKKQSLRKVNTRV